MGHKSEFLKNHGQKIDQMISCEAARNTRATIILKEKFLCISEAVKAMEHDQMHEFSSENDALLLKIAQILIPKENPEMNFTGAKNAIEAKNGKFRIKLETLKSMKAHVKASLLKRVIHYTQSGDIPHNRVGELAASA